MVLTNNIFTFNDEHLIKVKGMAMGTKIAPTYATFTLGFLETKLHQTSEEMWNKTFKEYLVKNWKRFLDDRFILWDFDDEYQNNISNLLNTLDPYIQFTI